MKIYRAAQLLRDDGYEKDKALAILRRGQFASVPAEMVKRYVDKAYEEIYSPE
jgi:hypothetical protein